MSEIEEVKYYDMLYHFTSVIVRLNDIAFDGETKKNIEKRICKLIPAFTTLCGVNLTETPKEIPQKPKPKTVLHSNLIVRDGWGLCPKCGRKCVKVNENTILVNHLMFCKSCKKEYPVTWRYEPKQ